MLPTSKPKRFPQTLLLAAFFIAGASIPGQVPPCAAGPYKSSAHGDSTAGVKRSSTTDYAQGNCAHCHEMHSSMGGGEPTPNTPAAGPDPYALFYASFSGKTTNTYDQTDLFCFFCHAATSSYQVNGIDNKDYSATFGGYTTDSPLGIHEAFNQFSYHNLNDIKTFITDPSRSGWGFTAASNPCTGCHNPHLAKRNKANVQDPSYTALSRPSAHADLWGDDDNAGERMDEITGNDYQAPYDDNGAYEPLGSTTGDGANMPAYNTLCLDCHSQAITSTVLSAVDKLNRNLYPIDWTTTGGDATSAGDKHGANTATTIRSTLAPYGSIATKTNYTLACVDCHEPHGSPNAFLLRRQVNNVTASGSGPMYSIAVSPPEVSESTIGFLCEKCHANSSGGWSDAHHNEAGGAEGPYDKKAGCGCHPDGNSSNPIPCENCHFHGAYVDPVDNPYGIPIPDNAPTTRVLF